MVALSKGKVSPCYSVLFILCFILSPGLPRAKELRSQHARQQIQRAFVKWRGN
jgi:hypothetical protein